MFLKNLMARYKKVKYYNFYILYIVLGFQFWEIHIYFKIWKCATKEQIHSCYSVAEQGDVLRTMIGKQNIN